jgi:hypothetical protein
MKGTTKYESIIDGRYFVGQVYQNIWIDNMGTGMMFLNGTFDESTNMVGRQSKSMEIKYKRKT